MQDKRTGIIDIPQVNNDEKKMEPMNANPKAKILALNSKTKKCTYAKPIVAKVKAKTGDNL